MQNNFNIILIGFMGSGKTTVGKALAKKLNYSFLDSDIEIEKQEKMSVSAIFQSKGEAYFRKLEHDFLKSISIRETILATGGGMPCFNENLRLLSDLGRVIYLNVSFSTISKRINSKDKIRPLIDDKVQVLYTERQEIYQKAPIIIDGEQNVDEIITKALASI